MLGTRTRKIGRELLARKTRTLLVSMAIFVGVAGTIALFSMGDILMHQLGQDIKPEQIAMVNVLVTVDNLTPLDDPAYLELLNRYPNVTQVQASTQATAFFKLSVQASAFHKANVISYSSPFDNLQIEPMRLVTGRYPEAGQQEVAVEQRFADKYNLRLGDTLYFRTYRPTFEDWLPLRQAGIESWTISGIVFHPYVLAPSDTIYAHPADNTILTSTRGYNVFSARFVDYPTAHRTAKNFSDVIAQDTPYLPIFTQRQDPFQNPLTVGARRLSDTLRLLSLVALFVSGFLVINVISSVIAEQRRQIGMMKALGATRFDCILMYCGLALAYGVIGVVPGVLVGVPIGYWIARALAEQVNTLLGGFVISLPSVLIGVATGLLVPLAASLAPVLEGTRISILEAMTDSGIKASYRVGLLGRLIDWLPLPRLLRQALRNMLLKKARLTLTVLTLAIAVGSFMGILAVFNSIGDELRNFLDKFSDEIAIAPTLRSDPEVVRALLESYLQDEATIRQGFQLPIEIEGYEPLIALENLPSVMAYGYELLAGDPAPHGSLEAGRPLTPADDGQGVILSTTLASSLDKQVGDEITVHALGNRSQLSIVGISDSPLEEVWMSWQTLVQISGYSEFLPNPHEYLTRVTVEGYHAVGSGSQVAAVGLDVERQDLLKFIEGSFFKPDEAGVMISAAMAQRGNYHVGDSITLRDGDRTLTAPIVGIFTPPADFTDIAISTDFVALYWRELAALEGRSPEDIPLPQAYFISSLVGDLSAEELDDLLAELGDTLLQAGIPASLFNFVGLLESLSANLRVFQAVLSAVALLIAIVGALGLLSTLSMSVFERQREIGVMRSVGATSFIIAAQFLAEGLMVGWLAWLLGIPIGIGLAHLILDVTGLSDTLRVEFTVSAALIGLIGLMAITALASLLPSWAAARCTVSDILRYQ